MLHRRLTELFDFYVYCVFTIFGVSHNRFFTDDIPQYPTLAASVRRYGKFLR
jgi:hypothetical protein